MIFVSSRDSKVSADVKVRMSIWNACKEANGTLAGTRCLMLRLSFDISSREGLPSVIQVSQHLILTPQSQQWPGSIHGRFAALELVEDLIHSLAMAEEPSRPDLTASSATIPSDSENYSSSQNELSPSPPSSSSSPMILYSPPTIWGLLRGAAINILLPFVNGLMLGFGELFAHEVAFRLGWSGTKVRTLFVL